MLLFSEVQGLGILDVELLEETLKLRIGSRSSEDIYKTSRYLILSKLWVLGAYEIIRIIKRKTEEKDILKEETKRIIQETLTLFRKIRIPLAKFEKMGRKETLYSGIADSFIDPKKGAGWRVYEHHKKELKKSEFYRKDLADNFLNLLNKITKDILDKLP